MQALSRRAFLLLSAAAAAARKGGASMPDRWSQPWKDLAQIERPRVLRDAQRYLPEQPRTITSAPAPRSAGGLHDYFSEGDYWWPDPANPIGPYIRRDGESNPDNFVAHRELLLQLSMQMPALTAAWLVTRERGFAEHAVAHLHAWFVDPETRMNPNLEYAQAIHGVDTGRSIGIIDTVHLVEVAQAASMLEEDGAISGPDRDGVRSWFRQYLDWLTNSDRGKQERDQKNNHGSCWVLQALEFAVYAGNAAVRIDCRARFEDVLVREQIAADGSFPLELVRTKPYSYSLFNLDILGMIAQILTEHERDEWKFRSADGRGLDAAFRFMFPYIEDKQRWPYRHDVEYFDDLPVRQPSLLFAGHAYHRPEYVELWQRLNGDPTAPEVIRNHPVRQQPLLWIGRQRFSS